MQNKYTSISPCELGLKLHDLFKKKDLTQLDIALETGIDQSQVSRILNGKFKSVDSKNVKKICKYAELEIRRKAKPRRKAHQSDLLMRAIDSVWDGSDKQEKVLAKLIRAVKPMLTLKD